MARIAETIQLDQKKVAKPKLERVIDYLPTARAKLAW